MELKKLEIHGRNVLHIIFSENLPAGETAVIYQRLISEGYFTNCFALIVDFTGVTVDSNVSTAINFRNIMEKSIDIDVPKYWAVIPGSESTMGIIRRHQILSENLPIKTALVSNFEEAESWIISAINE